MRRVLAFKGSARRLWSERHMVVCRRTLSAEATTLCRRAPVLRYNFIGSLGAGSRRNQHQGTGQPSNSDEACWNCGGKKTMVSLFCPKCNSIQKPSEEFDHFNVLGLPLSFQVDKPAMEKAFFELQKRLHPDKYSQKSDEEQEYSTDHSARINEAYQTLKSPLQRAVYLLEHHGIDALSEGGETQTDPIILMQVMEDRETLEECNDPDELRALRDKALADVESIEALLVESFQKKDLDDATSETIRLKYASKLVEEISEKLASQFGVYD